MTLVIDAPLGHESERRYILGVVLSDWLGLEWRMRQENRADVRISLDGESGQRCIIAPDALFGASAHAWLEPASLPRTPLRTLVVDSQASPSPVAGQPLPIIFGWAPTDPTVAAHGSDEIRLEIDVFGSAFFMLARYEEAVVAERDSYGRFAAATSLAGREGFLSFPIVDAYVELLWTALEQAWPRLRRKKRNYDVLLTHDVDDPLASLGRGPIDIARQFAADVMRRRDLRLVGRRARSLVMRGADHACDPHNTFDFLMTVSERNGLSSAFYFQSHRKLDVGAGVPYELEHPWIRGTIRRLHDRGHEIGYHAGFGTYLDPKRTAAEFEHLRNVAAREGVRQDRWGGRQHYLQWAVPTTWRNWEEAGLAYDCTVAYADAIGFRTGTCHEFQVYDLAERRPLELRERPFQVMDVTLFGYMALAPDAASAAVTRIAEECRRYRGSLGILWHNDSLLRTAREKRWYAALVDAVAPGG